MLSFGNAIMLGTTSGSTAIERVFSTFLYTGNTLARRLEGGTAQGSNGALHWIKRRNAAANHYLFDTARGSNYQSSNLQDAQTASAVVSNITDSGLNIAAGNAAQNPSGGTMVMWSFVKSRKFFDVIEYTGNGVADRAIPHSLGVAPGMVIIKPYETSTNWTVSHRSVNANLFLNLTVQGSGSRSVRELNQNNFTVSDFSGVNGAGTKYIAYVFADDPSASGVIQCGAYTGASPVPTISLGWEPQWLLIKRSDGSGDWGIWDNKRNTSNPRNTNLRANSDAAESGVSVDFIANGFRPTGYSFSGANYVYMAIRKGAA